MVVVVDVGFVAAAATVTLGAATPPMQVTGESMPPAAHLKALSFAAAYFGRVRATSSPTAPRIIAYSKIATPSSLSINSRIFAASMM